MNSAAPWIVAAAAGACVGLLVWMVQGIARDGLRRYRHTFDRSARVSMSELFLFFDVNQLWAAHVALVAALAAIGGWIGQGWLFAGLGALAGIWAPRRTARWLRGRRLRRFDAQLPDALLGLASALRVGASLQAALRHVVADSQPPLAQEFSLLQREQRFGVGLEQALSNLGERVPTEAASLVVAALRIAADTGGNLAETLERIGATVRERLHMEGRIRALTAQGRLQARVVGVLPWLLILALHQLEPEVMRLLWTSPEGWAVLALIAALDLLGLWMIARIVRIDV